ncbi:zinc transporter ZitB [Aureimonas endophytica]|uniref:Zinc transporter ZitB n=1 Tax=Aureimonas endophytica TaxID=2027858 RepID=A0A916ZQW6_9HYPH|nr:cation diffusion facilitator family transporter [Aureimonas endophytica]GGE09720.1 zinc transporter ZitB [Aureimonas endophytica]
MNSTEHRHDHSHSHGHSHDHAEGASERRIAVAAALTGLFMLAEIAGGLISGSLALLADAGHMFVDFAGLALAYLAFRIARRPADARNTYGYDRFQILVAYSNGLVLFGITFVIVIEAWRRLAAPEPVLGGTMLAVAIGGLLVNIVAFFVLHGGDKEDLNLRGALLHVMGDLLGSVAAIGAALVILWTGWTPIDPILSVVVSLLILVNAWRLVRDAGHILLEGAPAGVETGAIGPGLTREIAGVVDIHHVHVWAITPKRKAATLHARIAEEADAPAVVRSIKLALSERFGISHATVEIEYGLCADRGLAGGHEHGHDHDHGHSHDHPHAEAHRHKDRHEHRHGETGRDAPHVHPRLSGAPA